MSQVDLFYRFGAALVIGMLIGLEREYAGQPDAQLFAGVRTFALIALSGCAAALVSSSIGTPFAFVAVFLVLGALLSVAYFVAAGRNDVGLTTEVSALLTFIFGALCYLDYVVLAAALGVITTVLLSFKGEMHSFAHRISREDMYATLKFAVITAIVLPILPNRGYGPAPFDVLNPYRIWLMVVLISGISFFGYVLIKLLPGHSGVGVTGLLGGLVSSTAVTVSFAQRSRQMASLARPFAFAVVIAWTVMFLRTPIEIAVVNPDLLGGVWPPMTAATAAMIVYAGIMYYSDRRAIQGDLSFSNPFELRPAIAFGFLYALILVVARAAQIYFGEWGIYLSAVFGGIADVNAVTLSVAELNRTGNLQATTAVQAVVLAAVSNTVVKAVIVAVVGSGAMLRAVILAVPVGIAGALVALWFF